MRKSKNRLSSDDIGSDIASITRLSKEKADLSDAYDLYLQYLSLEGDVKDSFEMENSGDPELAEFAKETRRENLSKMEAMEGEFKTILLPKDPNDDKNIIVEIRGAVGGDEANLFAGDLLDMYARYAEKQGWKIQLLDASPEPRAVTRACLSW